MLMDVIMTGGREHLLMFLIVQKGRADFIERHSFLEFNFVIRFRFKAL